DLEHFRLPGADAGEQHTLGTGEGEDRRRSAQLLADVLAAIGHRLEPAKGFLADHDTASRQKAPCSSLLMVRTPEGSSSLIVANSFAPGSTPPVAVSNSAAVMSS